MSGNRELILAGIKGGGSGGTGLGWFGPIGTVAPTTANLALNSAFLDVGLVDKEGLTRSVSESSNDIEAFGQQGPVRTITTSSKVTFKIKFLESNPVALAVYHRLPLGAIVPDVNGAFDFTEGEARTETYAGVFDNIDGDNYVRAYCPTLEVTGREEFAIKGGAGIMYGVELTAYPGDDGVAVHWFYLVPELAGA